MKVKENLFKRTPAGLLTGLVNGLFGGGGGMVAVPLLRSMLGYEDKQAHATAIFIIAPICAASALIYIINGYARLDVIIPAAIGSVAGGLLGAVFLEKFPKTIINYVFIALMFAAGIRMITA
ncbi:MAG: sulfite exporter TauE/SafE family protein [Clostridia bacterium]|nr:sulfite exporter TauE/SafE family protein [Clostridia bacterium]